MKKHAMAALLAVVGLTLVSCGGNAGGGDQGGMQGMNQGGSGGDSKFSQQATQETTGGGMAGMDHPNMDHGENGSGGMVAMSRQMVMPGGEYSDAAFVDSMVPHHEGAVEMAEVGLENAEHEEIRQLSQNIIDSQRAEIEMFGRIREGLDGPSMKMSEANMAMMGMMEDPQQLASEDPFDKAFIDKMIPHHQSAIAMAEVALKKSEDPEIREIAGDIVEAQKKEIARMEAWRQDWFPAA
jgi:uncharacterized protein (DUF305 family)